MICYSKEGDLWTLTLASCFTRLSNTLPETNIISENRPSPKEISSSNHWFRGALLVSGRVMPHQSRGKPFLQARDFYVGAFTVVAWPRLVRYTPCTLRCQDINISNTVDSKSPPEPINVSVLKIEISTQYVCLDIFTCSLFTC